MKISDFIKKTYKNTLPYSTSADIDEGNDKTVITPYTIKKSLKDIDKKSKILWNEKMLNLKIL